MALPSMTTIRADRPIRQLTAGFLVLLIVIAASMSRTSAQESTLATPASANSASATTATASSTTDQSWFTKTTQWHGFEQFHFRIKDRDAYLVVPVVTLEGKPWIWRARFPGYHDEMDRELVGHGYHLAYLDVANEFGCPKVVEEATDFYRFLVDGRGLNVKVVLEGVSRGGLFVYNWAAKNPGRVACIYCDTPVCDFRSWPGGKGSGIGSPSAWKTCLSAYGLSEAEAHDFDEQPIAKAVTLANAKIPILHIVSENDVVVPPDENTYRVRDKLREAGHDMTILSVPRGTEQSNGHHFDHPHPERVIEFIRQHCEAGSAEKSR